MQAVRCMLSSRQQRYTTNLLFRTTSLPSSLQQHKRCIAEVDQRLASVRFKSTRISSRAVSTALLSTTDYDNDSDVDSDNEDNNSNNDNDNLKAEIARLRHLRNVGIFAHVDAGKTTVTERMLALAGIIKQAGSVDDGNTVTDYLPAERERGITIQSAAISFDWAWHNNKTSKDDSKANDSVTISLIDTPGHVDFSVEVNRSVAVLDGAVLVVDAAAGVQAQTETVWRAMTRPSLNNHDFMYNNGNIVNEIGVVGSNNKAIPAALASSSLHSSCTTSYRHEPLPCLALINKMDKEGSHFAQAIQSMEEKLPGAYPVPIQVPLFRAKLDGGANGNKTIESDNFFERENIIAVPIDQVDGSAGSVNGDFVGVVDLVHMRAIIWPDQVEEDVDCVPHFIPLQLENSSNQSIDCEITKIAVKARQDLIEALADCDEVIESYYLAEVEPSVVEIRKAIRRTTLSHKTIPVLASAALRGRGIEPVLDAVADFLPSPLDRQPPEILKANGNNSINKNNSIKSRFAMGHALNQRLLALAFKVVHMKGRGGGDGRVVFARVYAGELHARDAVQVMTPQAPGEGFGKFRTERIGGMLELAGGRFENISDGVCKSGSVCALVGLKSVVTGDTITISNANNGDRKKRKKSSAENSNEDNDVFCLAGVSAPRPVLTVRLEAETSELQTKLSEALKLLAIEDPSLVVQETDSSTLLSGLGELHIEITVDRLKREFGLDVIIGRPSVAHRETINTRLETDGLFVYDRMIGDHRMRADVHIILEPTLNLYPDSPCMVLAEPALVIGDEAREFLELDMESTIEELMETSPLARSLVQGCLGALRRGALGAHPTANLRCYVVNVNTDDGLTALSKMPGALRAATASAISNMLQDNKDSCTVLEPTMRIEVSVPSVMVGAVLSDITSRRGTIGEVLTGDSSSVHSKTLIRGDVPLSEILGYANLLRSLTGGEGTFTAEYKGHSPVSY